MMVGGQETRIASARLPFVTWMRRLVFFSHRTYCLTGVSHMAELNIAFFDCSGPRYGSSTATRNRRKSKRKNKGGKPGHPGSFSEGRLTLFEEYQSDFNKLTKMARNSQNQFWASFFNVYWARFPYTVPLKEEPSPSTLLVPDESAFTDEQRAQKGKTLKATVKVRTSTPVAIFNPSDYYS